MPRDSRGSENAKQKRRIKHGGRNKRNKTKRKVRGEKG